MSAVAAELWDQSSVGVWACDGPCELAVIWGKVVWGLVVARGVACELPAGRLPGSTGCFRPGFKCRLDRGDLDGLLDDPPLWLAFEFKAGVLDMVDQLLSSYASHVE